MQVLNLSYNWLNEDSFSPDVFTRIRTLTTLDLQRNRYVLVLQSDTGIVVGHWYCGQTLPVMINIKFCCWLAVADNHLVGDFCFFKLLIPRLFRNTACVPYSIVFIFVRNTIVKSSICHTQIIGNAEQHYLYE